MQHVQSKFLILNAQLEHDLMQVLSLEARLTEQQQQQAASDKLLQRAQAEAQRAQHALRTAQQDPAGPARGLVDGPGSRMGGRLQDRAPSGMLDVDSWAEPASVEVCQAPQQSCNMYISLYTAPSSIWNARC